jgi:hypothetical protein
MEISRVLAWAIGLPLLIFGGYVSFANAAMIWLWYFRRIHSSTVPLAGGIAVAVAFLLLPIHSLHRWCWLPLLLDFGCVPMFTNMLTIYLYHKITKTELK